MAASCRSALHFLLSSLIDLSATATRIKPTDPNGNDLNDKKAPQVQVNKFCVDAGRTGARFGWSLATPVAIATNTRNA
uniref:Putative secreted protein n=1 Tax=Anopheles marajoara TaxID=58244 RepID=A0A2M4CCE7_9DIPT